MTKLVLALAAALVLAFPAAAAKPHVASLAVGAFDGSTVVYDVEFTGHKNVNTYLLWVSHWCYDAAGVQATAEYRPVIWEDATNGHTDEFAVPIGYTGNPATGPVTECRAFVSLWPDVWTPRSNTVEV